MPVSRNSSIQKLDTYIDSEVILRVGCRLKINNDVPLFKNSIILHAKHHVTIFLSENFMKMSGTKNVMYQKVICVSLDFGSSGVKTHFICSS